MDIDGVEETKDDSIQVENKDGNEQINKIPYAVEIYKYKEYKIKKDEDDNTETIKKLKWKCERIR